MTELKTLKDIEDEENGRYSEMLPIKLRTEAIKWVIELEGLKLITEETRLFTYFHSPSRVGQSGYSTSDVVVNFIKHFFNLTEDDLK